MLNQLPSHFVHPSVFRIVVLTFFLAPSIAQAVTPEGPPLCLTDQTVHRGHQNVEQPHMKGIGVGLASACHAMPLLGKTWECWVSAMLTLLRN